MSLLKEALEYAGRGWPVLLCYGVKNGVCTCKKGATCESPGKHPIEGFSQKSATTDGDLLDKWFSLIDAKAGASGSTQGGSTNLAILTGATSGIFVLDIDPRNGGDVRLTELEEENEKLPFTLTADTGGGGCHLYFRYPDSQLITTSSRILGNGIDVKATSKSDKLAGYVLVPPSVTRGPYAWRNKSIPIAVPPSWLTDLLILNEETEGTRFEGLVEIAEGQRHDYLLSKAGKLHHDGFSAETVLQALRTENAAKCKPPLSEEEVKTIASGVVRYASPTFYLNDVGNAKRLVFKYGKDLKHCWQKKTWYVWEGRYWAPDDRGTVVRMAKSTVDWMHEDALLKGGDLGTALRKHASQSGRADRIGAMVEMARSEEAVAVRADQLDNHPMLLNCPNGLLDLSDATLRRHDQGLLITKISPTNYDPAAKSELWEKFLKETTNEDEELQTFLQRISGYALSGLTTEEAIFFVYGPGGTGKSTYFETFKAVLGDNYCKTASFSTFLKNKNAGGGGGARSDIARLPGARLVTAVETEEGKAFAADLLKVSTGGDKITTRDLYQSEFEFLPQYKIWLAANSKPRVRDDDSGIWRRLLLIPFYHIVHNPNKKLKDILRTSQRDREGILAWAVRGFLDWQRYGWTVPTTVLKETKAYKDEMDTLNAWLDDCCSRLDNGQATAKSLWDSYEDWMRKQPSTVRDGKIDTLKTFSAEMQKKGFPTAVIDQGGKPTKIFKGIALSY